MLYAEHWIARPAWQAMPVHDRIAFLDQLGPDLDRFRAAGATLVGAVLRESKRLHRTDCHYHALWRLPEGAAQVRQLRGILAAAGWGHYFEPATSDAAAPAPPKASKAPTRDRRRRVTLNGRRR